MSLNNYLILCLICKYFLKISILTTISIYLPSIYLSDFSSNLKFFCQKQGMITLTLSAWLPNFHPPPCSPEQLAQNQCVKANTTHLGVLNLSILFLTIGSAGIIPCSIPFGVDQFDPTTNKGQKGINSYFNWYYTTFTVILLITQTVVVYIQDSISWTIGFGIPTLCMFFSIIMFFVGTRIYVLVKPEGSIFAGIAQVLVAAYKKRHVKLPSDNKIDGIFYDPPLLEGSSILSKLPFTDQFRLNISIMHVQFPFRNYYKVIKKDLIIQTF